MLQINYLFSKNLLLLFYVETQGIARENYENAKKVTVFKLFYVLLSARGASIIYLLLHYISLAR